MLFLLSPAKTLDYTTAVPAELQSWASEPLFAPQAAELIDVLRGLDVQDIAGLMDLSETLATLNRDRYHAWSLCPSADQVKPAILAFNGDVYEGLQAGTLDLHQMLWAQSHLVLLSGLYGALRPLDRLQPYRLEMGTRLKNARGRNLYEFWGDTVAQHLNGLLCEDRHPVIVNLASQEYSRVALRPALRARVVDCVFEDYKDGRYKVIGFHAKRARGLMARWAIEHEVSQTQELCLFRAEGYRYEPGLSTSDVFVFRRRLAD